MGFREKTTPGPGKGHPRQAPEYPAAIFSEEQQKYVQTGETVRRPSKSKYARKVA